MSLLRNGEERFARSETNRRSFNDGLVSLWPSQREGLENQSSLLGRWDFNRLYPTFHFRLWRSRLDEGVWRSETNRRSFDDGLVSSLKEKRFLLFSSRHRLVSSREEDLSLPWKERGIARPIDVKRRWARLLLTQLKGRVLRPIDDGLVSSHHWRWREATSLDSLPWVSALAKPMHRRWNQRSIIDVVDIDASSISLTIDRLYLRWWKETTLLSFSPLVIPFAFTFSGGKKGALPFFLS